MHRVVEENQRLRKESAALRSEAKEVARRLAELREGRHRLQSAKAT